MLKRITPGTSGKVFFQSYILSAADQAVLEAAADEDGYKYAYNGAVSFLGALAGLSKHQAAWAVTKLYYCAFYVARAILCRRRYVVFHVPKEGTNGNTQFELRIAAGERSTVATIPSTHHLIAKRFEKSGYPTFMQGLVVDGLDPMEWLMEQREFWQYRSGRFSDPIYPKILARVDMQRVQRLLSTYESDGSGIYISDPEHAMIAIPFRLLTWCLAQAPLRSASMLDSDDLAFLEKSCTTGSQHVSAVSRYLRA